MHEGSRQINPAMKLLLGSTAIAASYVRGFRG